MELNNRKLSLCVLCNYYKVPKLVKGKDGGRHNTPMIPGHPPKFAGPVKVEPPFLLSSTLSRHYLSPYQIR